MELEHYRALAEALKAQESKEGARAVFEAAIQDRSKMQLQIQNPSIGRVVLYHHANGKLLPALVVEVLDHDTFEARVVVFGIADGPGYLEPRYFDAPYDAAGTAVGAWSWQPRL